MLKAGNVFYRVSLSEDNTCKTPDEIRGDEYFTSQEKARTRYEALKKESGVYRVTLTKDTFILASPKKLLLLVLNQTGFVLKSELIAEWNLSQ